MSSLQHVLRWVGTGVNKSPFYTSLCMTRKQYESEQGYSLATHLDAVSYDNWDAAVHER